MGIIIKEVVTNDQIKQFVNLPFELYKHNKYWVPALKSDDLKALMPEYNPAMEICKYKFWLAFKNNKCVGRIGGLIIPLWNEKTGESLARFTRPEFIDDEEVVDKLMETFENWAKNEKVNGVMGPLGFSNLDQSGVLVEGHEWLPSVASGYHHDYYQNHFERLGYVKEIDWLEFRITFPESLPEKSYKVANMLKTRFGLKSLNFTNKKQLEPFKDKIFALFNDAFFELFGTYRLPDKLVRFYFEKYFPILNPKYVKVILDKEDGLAGFIIALPSLSKAMQKAGGKILPFGWWHIKKALEKPVEIDLMLTGVRPELQKMGVAALLMNDLWETANADGVKYVETTGMLENNHVAIQMWKSFDHIQHKRKRCYRKMF
ncbi:MAG: GNAT family N-acetyltransferase [Marinilabiliaceae bacterium]|nr:GNAT family N-acetyltransferase [Marinilabiliaceae bacterium]